MTEADLGTAAQHIANGIIGGGFVLGGIAMAWKLFRRGVEEVSERRRGN